MQKTECAALRVNGQWVCEAVAKANVFAETFARKWVSPDLELNCYTPVPQRAARDDRVLLPLRSGAAPAELRALRPDSGTGPDELPARILRECAQVLALPVAKLARRILDCGHWPRCWCRHWVMPLHKKSTVHNPDHYRGIQLTPQLSKCAKRLLALQPR